MERIKQKTIGVEDIKNLIPHRAPFLLIEQLEIYGDEAYGVGIKEVTDKEFWVEGHFPDWPVMPGVLIVEAMAQTAGALVVHHRGEEIERKVIYFMAIDKCRFRHPVTPGDELRMEVTKIKSRGAVWKYKGIARVGEQICVEAEFTAMNYDPDA